MLTADELRRVLKYDPEAGTFTWLQHTSNRTAPGRAAGHVCKRYGYRLIGVGGVLYKANRLAWLYMTGEWPSNIVDHKNGVRDDDAWNNLRLATHGQNLANAKKPAHNSSGFKGVHYHPQSGKWRARIAVNRRHKSLGLHSTPEAAHAAYCAAATEIHGEFARFE